jgi:hypothetical protein
MQKDTGILMLLTPIFVVAVVSTVTAHVLAQDSCISFVDSGQNLGIDDVFVSALGDVDGDGDNDLDAFATNYGSGNMVWLNDGAALFDSAGPFFGGSSQKIALRDLDGDGDLDACTTHLDNGNNVWVNDGTGTFTSAGPLLGSGGNLSVSLGNLDGDGDLDAVIGGSYYYGPGPRCTSTQQSRQEWTETATLLLDFGHTGSCPIRSAE